MKNRFCVALFVVLVPYLISGQIGGDSLGKVMIQNQSTRDAVSFNVQLNVNDSLDIMALDSLINVLDSVLNKDSRPSEIYGHDIFQADSLKVFQPSTIVKIPDAYVIGMGDEIAVSIFGASNFDGTFEVTNGGYIQPKDMPRIFLKGLSWGQAKRLLQKRFARYYVFRPEQFTTSVLAPRAITINIFGEVQRPGSYHLVATNTAFNALIAAGGLTKKGSVRNILISNGSGQKTMDIYTLMTKPIAQFDFYLEDNVIIQVPPLGTVVDIKGAINRPYKYELKDNEGLTDLISYAGGLSADAVREVIQIKRFEGDQKILLDVNLKDLMSKGQRFVLQNGDEVLIRAIESTVMNAVIVEGAVEMPGEYALGTTPHISDLIEKAKLKREARRDMGFLVRMNPDSTYKLIQIDLGSIMEHRGGAEDLQLQPGDRLVVNALVNYTDRTMLKVSGAVRKEIEYPFDPDNTITLEQALLLAGGLDREAADQGYIIRTNPTNTREKEYVRIDVKKALLHSDGTENILLEPLDEVVVLYSSEYTDVSSVAIEGAVREPGEFQYDASLSLRDLLILGGGLKREASGRIDVFRVSMEKGKPTSTLAVTIEVDESYNIVSGNTDFELRPHDKVVARMIPEFELQSMVTIEGAVQYPGVYALVDKNERLSSLINRAGGLTDQAFAEGAAIHREKMIGDSIVDPNSMKVIIRLDEVLSDKNSANNVILKGNDVIMIPKKEDVVFIEMKNTRAMELSPVQYSSNPKIAVTYTSGKSAKWYINNYVGGFGTMASKDDVTVTAANGAVQRGRRIGPFRKFPKPRKGATISIGRKMDTSQREASADVSRKASKQVRTNKGVIVNVGTNTDDEKKENKNEE